MKFCPKCENSKEESEFHKSKNTKDGLYSICKSCKKSSKKLFRENNPENHQKKLERRRAKRRKNRDRENEKQREYRSANPEKVKEYGRRAYWKDVDRKRENARKRRQKKKESNIKVICPKCNELKIPVNGNICHDCKLEGDRLYKSQNRESLSAKNREYEKNNREKVNKTKKEYDSKRTKEDPLYKLKKNLRTRIGRVFADKKLRKNKKSLEILGCDLETLKLHIESQFKQGMNWENHTLNGWHVDHIIPLALAKTEEELEKLCHYTNLQPLWATENLKKNDKLPNGTQARHINKKK